MAQRVQRGVGATVRVGAGVPGVDPAVDDERDGAGGESVGAVRDSELGEAEEVGEARRVGAVP